MSRSGPGAEGQGDLPQKGPASSPAEGELGMACKGHSRQLCTPLGNGAGQEGGEAGGGGLGGQTGPEQRRFSQRKEATVLYPHWLVARSLPNS